MREAAELLQNLVYRTGYLKTTIKEGIAALKHYAKELEVIHIRIDYPDPSTWRKRKYWHISKEEIWHGGQRNALVWNIIGAPIYIGKTGTRSGLIIAILLRVYLSEKMTAIER